MSPLKKINRPLLLFFIGFILGSFYFKDSTVFQLLFLGGFIFIAVSYHHPYLGLIATLCVYPILPDVLSLALIYAMVLLQLAHALFIQPRPLKIYPEESPYYVFLFMMVIATLTSYWFVGSLRDLGIHMGGFGLSLIILLWMTDKNRAYQMGLCLVLVSAILSIHGIIKYYGGADLDQLWLDIEQQERVTRRAYGIFGNPNIFAEYLVMLAPLSLASIGFLEKRWKKVFFAMVFLIQAFAIGLSMSRGGWLGLLISILVFIALTHRRLLLVVLPGAAVVLMNGSQNWIYRFLSIFNFADSSTSYRFKIWAVTEQMIRDHFIGGVGLGHRPYMKIFETYKPMMGVFHAHNTYLQVMAELGFLGFICFILFLGSLLGGIRKYLIKSEDKVLSWMGCGLFASFIGLLVHGMFENFLYLTKISTTFWVLMSLSFGLMRLSKEERLQSSNYLKKEGEEV